MLEIRGAAAGGVLVRKRLLTTPIPSAKVDIPCSNPKGKCWRVAWNRSCMCHGSHRLEGQLGLRTAGWKDRQQRLDGLVELCAPHPGVPVLVLPKSAPSGLLALKRWTIRSLSLSALSNCWN